MPKVTKVTLDTSLLQEYWKSQDKVGVVEKLLNLAEDGELDLAITTRIREDIPRPPLSNRINQLPELGVQEIGAPFRLDHSLLSGKDVLGSEEFSKFSYSLVLTLKQKGRKRKIPDWRDWDHIQGHYLARRDVFLTWDNPVLECAQGLEEKFGVVLMKPEDFVAWRTT